VLLNCIFRHGFLQPASKNALTKSFKKETKFTYVLLKSAVNTKYVISDRTAKLTHSVEQQFCVLFFVGFIY